MWSGLSNLRSLPILPEKSVLLVPGMHLAADGALCLALDVFAGAIALLGCPESRGDILPGLKAFDHDHCHCRISP